jgi:hypothetical protein
VVEPDTGLATVAKLTKTNGPTNSGSAMGAVLLTKYAQCGQAHEVEVLGDTAYATGNMLHILYVKRTARCSYRGQSSAPSPHIAIAGTRPGARDISNGSRQIRMLAVSRR